MAAEAAEAPIVALGKGIVAGMAATFLVSLLSRATFGTMDGKKRPRPRKHHPSEAIVPGEALALAADAGPEGSAG